MTTYPRTIPKADGALYEIRKGVFKRVVYVGLDPRGRQRQRTKTFRAANDTEARSLGKRYAIEMEDAPERRRDRPTVADLVDRWERDIESGKAVTTRRGRAYLVRAIRADLGPIDLVALTAADVDEWMAGLRRRHLSDTTISNHHAMLRAILGHGVRWRMVPDREATDLAEPPKRQRYRDPELITPAALLAVLATATPDLRMAALLAAGGGLRRGEVLGLRWGDIAYTQTGATIRVRRSAVDIGKAPNVERAYKPPKTRRTRTVEVGATVADALREHRAHLRRQCRDVEGARLVDDGPVIADLAVESDGSVRRRVGWLTLLWSRLATRHKISVRFHDLRHVHATHLLDQGVPLHLVQEQMGHAKASTTTDIYGHARASGGRLAAASDALLALPAS